MISGINGYNNTYSSQALLNQYRLSQVMQNRSSGTSAVSPVSKVTSSASYGTPSDSLSYLKSYSGAMTDLMSSSNTLRGGNSASVTNQKSAVSSDAAVLEASSRYKITSEQSYEIDVTQLAAAQVNVSEALSTTAKATSDLNMQIDIGEKSISVNVSADNGGTQRSNSQMLSEAAKQVNASGAGLKASVITKDGKSSLQIESRNTGLSNSFAVSGNFAETGKGGMSNVITDAQNASYSVTSDGITKHEVSESNTVNLGYKGIEATLKKEGKAGVSVMTDPEKIVSAMSDFVQNYNKAVTLLSNNTSRGSGTAAQLDRLQSSVPGSSQSMEKLGLSYNKDGTLSLNKTTLSANLKKEPDLTKELISGSSGLGQRAFNSSQSSLGASISGLIKNDLAEIQYSQVNDPMNFMSSYSRRGAYNMMNYYAAGTLFNTFA